MKIITQFSTPGVVFLLTVVFGLWLSHFGKPYKSLLFNMHKLIALGGVILTVVQLLKVMQNPGALFPIIALLVLAGLTIVALFASGALMSMDKSGYILLRTIHRVSPAVLAIALALLVYLIK